jgi:hypothetical protein
MLEKSVSVKPNADTLNETTIYVNKNNPSLDLMTRMENLYK